MTPAQRAQLALLLEVAATPKPGAVDRGRDHPTLPFEAFLAGSVGAVDGLTAAAAGEPLGPSFERAVAGMAAAQSAGNTQFGALLLLVPLVSAGAEKGLTPDGLAARVAATTVEDTVAFCRAFDHVDVAVGEPPTDLAALGLDVRDPAGAARAAEAHGVALGDLMEWSAAVDDVAREWATGFERSFAAADDLLDRDGPVGDRTAAVFLELLAARPDSFVAKRHGVETAERVADAAQAAGEGARDPDALAEQLVAEGVNPGSTADLLAAGLYVALERGLAV